MTQTPTEGSSETARPRRVYLHVGLQKTGTSYLQKIFWQSQDELARQGLDLVPGSRRATFDLMLDVRRRVDDSFDRPSASRALARLPRQLAVAPGDRVLISEEALAEAWPPRIRALLDACGDREVHVIFTLRDLGRQIPSAWQQLIQSGGSLTFEDYLARLGDRRNKHPAWANKDVIKLLRRWSAQVPPERVHIVTVAPAGSDPTLLLERFCRVLDVDASRLDTRLERRNESLGRVEAEVARRVNAHLDASHLRRDVYGDVGKRFFAVRVLGGRSGRKILVPAENEPWVRAVSQRFVDHLRSGAYDVVGDPEDLLPSASAFGDPEEGRPTEAEVAAASTAALAAVLGDRMDTLRARRERERAKRTKAAARPAGRARTLAGRAARGLVEQTSIVRSRLRHARRP